MSVKICWVVQIWFLISVFVAFIGTSRLVDRYRWMDGFISQFAFGWMAMWLKFGWVDRLTKQKTKKYASLIICWQFWLLHLGKATRTEKAAPRCRTSVCDVLMFPCCDATENMFQFCQVCSRTSPPMISNCIGIFNMPDQKYMEPLCFPSSPDRLDIWSSLTSDLKGQARLAWVERESNLGPRLSKH